MAEDAMDIEDSMDTGNMSTEEQSNNTNSVDETSSTLFRVVDIVQVRKQVALILKAHRADELVPESAKVVILEHRLPLSYALEALIENGIRGAPIWDSKSQKFVGMLTFVDVLEFLLHFCRQNVEIISRNVGEHTIESWREFANVQERRPSFLSIDAQGSLYDACMLFRKKDIHRLPILHTEENLILHVLTHSHVLRFVHQHLMSDSLVGQRHMMRTRGDGTGLAITIRSSSLEESPSLMDLFSSPIGLLGIGKNKNVLSMKLTDSLFSGIEMMNHAKISAIPIVDETGKLMDAFSRKDISIIAYNYAQLNGELTLQSVLSQHREVGRKIATYKRTESLKEVFDRFVTTRKHRIYCVDDQGKLDGVISLSDILAYFFD